MKLIFTFFAFTVSMLTLAQDAADSALRHYQAGTPTMRLRSCRTTKTDPSPLFIIDGILSDEHTLKGLNPNDILSIDILTGESLSRVGCRPVSGAVLITTKVVTKFIVKDFLTGEKIPGSTISIVSESDSLNAMTDDAGILVTNKLGRGSYMMTVSSSGYATVSTIVFIDKDKEQNVLLHRDIKSCAEIVVTPHSINYYEQKYSTGHRKSLS